MSVTDPWLYNWSEFSLLAIYPSSIVLYSLHTIWCNVFRTKVVNRYRTFCVRFVDEFDIEWIPFVRWTVAMDFCCTVRSFSKSYGLFADVNQAFQCLCRFVCLRRWIWKLKFQPLNGRINGRLVHKPHTAVGRLPRKFKSAFSPNRYASGCGVSNRSPPIIKCEPK